MAYPSAVTSGGAWPVRLWWVSSGTAPCYGSHRIDLRLASEGISADLALGADINRFIEGDHTCNVVLRLPELPAGTYTVGIRAAGYRLSMADAGLGPPDSDGFIPWGHSCWINSRERTCFKSGTTITPRVITPSRIRRCRDES